MTAPASATVEVCEERNILVKEYGRALDQYFAALMRDRELNRRALSTSDYQELCNGVEAARRFVDQARWSLRRHIMAHGCG